MRETITSPGPLIIEVETLPLRIAPELAKRNMEILAQWADWAYEAAPGKVIGFLGTNTLSNLPPEDRAIAKELANHVDAFFPSLYTFDDHRAGWEKRAQAEARVLDTKKPTYFYLWPQYHDGSVKALRVCEGDCWKFQLETARRYGNGVVLWSPGHYVWDETSGWWAATRKFAMSQR